MAGIIPWFRCVAAREFIDALMDAKRDLYDAAERAETAEQRVRELGDKLMAAQVALEMTMEERDEARKQADA